MTDQERLETVLMLADEIGSKWRGDWSDFDGRTLRSEMNELRQVASGKLTVEQYRRFNGLCALGGGHWTKYCYEIYDCYSADNMGDAHMNEVVGGLASGDKPAITRHKSAEHKSDAEGRS